MMKALFQAVQDCGSDLRSTPTSQAVGYSAESYSISVTNVGRTLHLKVPKNISAELYQEILKRMHLRIPGNTKTCSQSAGSIPALKWVKSGFEPLPRWIS